MPGCIESSSRSKQIVGCFSCVPSRPTRRPCPGMHPEMENCSSFFRLFSVGHSFSNLFRQPTRASHWPPHSRWALGPRTLGELGPPPWQRTSLTMIPHDSSPTTNEFNAGECAKKAEILFSSATVSRLSLGARHCGKPRYLLQASSNRRIPAPSVEDAARTVQDT